MLLGVAPDGDGTAAVRGVAAAIITALEGSVAVVGISRAAALSALPRAFREAEECLRFARVSGAAGVLEYSSLGLHLLLASLVDGPELAAFVEAELGPLLEYDAKARSPLLPTLRALLAHDSNRAEAARALHLERRSLYYRIERIEQILGQSLNDSNIRLGLSVALRALNLIEDRSNSRHPS
jgi:purine catabolism regulator